MIIITLTLHQQSSVYTNHHDQQYKQKIILLFEHSILSGPRQSKPPFCGAGLLQFLSHNPVSSFTFHNDHPPFNTKEKVAQVIRVHDLGPVYMGRSYLGYRENILTSLQARSRLVMK